MIEIIIDKEEEKKTIGVIENGKLIEVYEENKDLRFENEEQRELIDRIKRIATSNAYNNEKAILSKIKELISDSESEN